MNKKPLHIGAAVLQLLGAILWFVPAMVYSVGGYNRYTGENNFSEKTSSITEIFDGAPIIIVVIVALIALSLLMIVLPIIKKETDKRHKLTYSKIFAIVSLIFFVALVVIQYMSMKNYFEYGAICELTIGGWIFIVVHILLIITLFKISGAKKRKSKENVE